MFLFVVLKINFFFKYTHENVLVLKRDIGQVFPAFGQLKLEVITSNDQVGKKDNVEPCQT
jgi:hypothetical protein